MDGRSDHLTSHRSIVRISSHRFQSRVWRSRCSASSSCQHRFIFLRVCPSLLQSRATCNANSACCANKRASLQVYCIHTAYRVQYLASHSPPNPNPDPTDTKALALRIRHGCGRTTTALLPPIQKRVALKHRNLNRDTHMRVKRVRSMQLPVCTCVILFSWDGLA